MHIHIFMLPTAMVRNTKTLQTLVERIYDSAAPSGICVYGHIAIEICICMNTQIHMHI